MWEPSSPASEGRYGRCVTDGLPGKSPLSLFPPSCKRKLLSCASWDACRSYGQCVLPVEIVVFRSAVIFSSKICPCQVWISSHHVANSCWSSERELRWCPQEAWLPLPPLSPCRCVLCALFFLLPFWFLHWYPIWVSSVPRYLIYS